MKEGQRAGDDLEGLLGQTCRLLHALEALADGGA